MSQPAPKTVVAVYADGGVIGRNPSLIGGTWAWAHVDAAGERIATGSGVVEPETAGVPAITNNYTEMIAILNGLAELPEGWAGIVCSDSKITLGRLFWEWKWTGIPARIIRRAAIVLQRLDLANSTVLLVDGHPTAAQLAAGVGKRGGPVSEHNVWCDAECGRRGRAFRKAA